MSVVSPRERGQRPANPAAAPTTIAGPARGWARTAAWLSLGASALFVALLAALHMLKPELDPSWRMISEYAIGRHGWLMSLAFVALTVSYLGAGVAAAPRARGVAGRLGLALALLLVSALGTLLAGICTTDPITIRADAVTASGRMHGLGFTLGVPTFPLAASLITWALSRSLRRRGARRAVALAAAAVWLSLLLFGVAMATQFTGAFGPDVQIGWQNRLLILAYSAWAATVAS